MKQYTFIKESFTSNLQNLKSIDGNDVRAIKSVIQFFNKKIKKCDELLFALRRSRSEKIMSKYQKIMAQRQKLVDNLDNLMEKYKGIKQGNFFDVPLYVTKDGDVFRKFLRKNPGTIEHVADTIKPSRPTIAALQIRSPDGKKHTLSKGRVVSKLWNDNGTDTSVITRRLRDRPIQGGVGNNYVIKHLDGNSLNNAPTNLQWVKQDLNRPDDFSSFSPISVDGYESLKSLAFNHGIPYTTIHSRFQQGLRGLDLIKPSQKSIPVEGFKSIKDYIQYLSQKHNLPVGTLTVRYGKGLRGEDLIKPLVKPAMENELEGFKSVKDYLRHLSKEHDIKLSILVTRWYRGKRGMDLIAH